MKRFFILLIVIFSTKSETWDAEVNGHNISDKKNGYSGNYTFSDFYLCSERKYRVHYKNDDKTIWSKEFSACQPVGIGREIDAIAISGGLPYGCKNDKVWVKNVTEYDIYTENGYTGIIGGELLAIYIYGDEYYRGAYTFSDSTNEKEVSYRIIKSFFRTEYNNFNHEKETEIYLNDNTKINITIKLLYPYQLKFKGKIIYKSMDRKIQYDNSENIISNRLKTILNQVIDFDFDKIETIIKDSFSNRNLNCGDTFFNFNWKHNLIEIEVAIKMETLKKRHKSLKVDYHGYRGGFKMNIYLNNEDDKLLTKIREICQIILRYYGIIIPSSIKKLLSSEFKNFNDVGKVLNAFGPFSIIAEKVILFEIFSKIYVPEEDQLNL